MALAGQFTASDAHSVTVYVDVVRMTVVAMSLRARSTSPSLSAMVKEPCQRVDKPWHEGQARWKQNGPLTLSCSRQDSCHSASHEGRELEDLHDGTICVWEHVWR